MAVTASYSSTTDVLTVTGDTAGNTITISRTASGNILVNGGAVTITGGTPTVANTTSIAVSSLDGNDSVSFDETNGALPSTNIVGGRGDDTLSGTSGIDTFTWNPGEGNDTIDGRAGSDALVVNGANVNETINISASGSHVTFTRDVSNVTLDLHSVEQIQYNALGGSDDIRVLDLTGTGVTQVTIDLAGTLGGSSSDGAFDDVVAEGTAGNDNISLLGIFGGLIVSGLAAPLAISHLDSNDAVQIAAGTGDDVVDLSGFGGVSVLAVDGGPGTDTAVFSHARAAYTITRVGSGVQVSGPDGTETLTNIELLRFTDVTVPANPTITSNGGGDSAGVSIQENSTAVTTVSATEADTHVTFAYSISGGADAGKFTINSSTGALSFIAAPDFERPADSDHNNSYIVQVRASDGSLTDDQLITVTVTDDGVLPHWIASSDIGTHPAGYQLGPIGDFNHDGTSDVPWFNAVSGDFDLWKISGGHWAGSIDIGPHPAGYAPVASGDFNADGTSDVLWYNAGSGDAEVWKIVNGQWAGSVDIGPHPAGWQAVGSGDFNHDGTSDVLWFNSSNGDAEVWKISNGQWAGSVDIGAHPAGYTPVATGDFDGDGTSDVLWYNPATRDVDLWRISDGHWAGSVDIGAHPAGYTLIGAGDFNNDGTSDVLWFNPASGDAEIWKLSNGHWAGSVDLGTHPPGYAPVAIGDFDHNGTADILWQQAGTNHVEAWLLASS